jgi:hypothetical protein
MPSIQSTLSFRADSILGNTMFVRVMTISCFIGYGFGCHYQSPFVHRCSVIVLSSVLFTKQNGQLDLFHLFLVKKTLFYWIFNRHRMNFDVHSFGVNPYSVRCSFRLSDRIVSTAFSKRYTMEIFCDILNSIKRGVALLYTFN